MISENLFIYYLFAEKKSQVFKRIFGKMSDAFNPQEILARLRAKPVTAQFSTNNNSNVSSSASQSKGNNHQISSASSVGSSSHTNANNKSRNTTANNANVNSSSSNLGFGVLPAQHPYVVSFFCLNYLLYHFPLPDLIISF